MSELKELSWSIQEKVEPVPFEQLERRGVRRRRRKQALAGVGVAAATTVAVLAVVLPLGNKVGSEQPPIAVLPTPAPDKAAEAVVRSKDAQIRQAVVLSPTRWAAAWNGCPGGTCKNSAVLRRDGLRATAPPTDLEYAVLRNGDNVVAGTVLAADSFSASDPSWAKAKLVGLTAQGRTVTPLQYARATQTFGADEILTTELSQSRELLVLNLRDATLRKLDAPDITGLNTPIKDGTGRWWALVADGNRSDIAWTDDGKTWDSALLDPDHRPGTLAISPNGSTIVATSTEGAGSAEPISKLVMSTDRGATWKPVLSELTGREAAPVAFDDGTALMMGVNSSDTRGLYRISVGGAARQPGTPPKLWDFGGGVGFLWGSRIDNGPVAMTKAVTSTDDGRTWQAFEPR